MERSTGLRSNYLAL